MESDVTHSTAFYNFLGWLESNRKRLIGIASALLVIGFIMGFLIWSKNEREIAASQALSKLLPSAGGVRGESVQSESYLKVAREHPDTTAAEQALLLGAAALFTEGDYAGAQAQFERFRQAHGQSPLAVQALIGVAASLEAQGKHSEAAAKYQEFLTRHPREHAVSQAKYSLARLQEALGNPEGAHKLYLELAGGGVGGSFAAEAEVRIQELEQAHPELVKAPAEESTTLPAP